MCTAESHFTSMGLILYWFCSKLRLLKYKKYWWSKKCKHMVIFVVTTQLCQHCRVRLDGYSQPYQINVTHLLWNLVQVAVRFLMCECVYSKIYTWGSKNCVGCRNLTIRPILNVSENIRVGKSTQNCLEIGACCFVQKNKLYGNKCCLLKITR